MRSTIFLAVSAAVTSVCAAPHAARSARRRCGHHSSSSVISASSILASISSSVVSVQPSSVPPIISIQPSGSSSSPVSVSASSGPSPEPSGAPSSVSASSTPASASSSIPISSAAPSSSAVSSSPVAPSSSAPEPSSMPASSSVAPSSSAIPSSSISVAPPKPSNQVVNGDFETDEGWVIGTADASATINFADTDASHSGLNAASITFDEASSQNKVSFRQAITLKENTRYHIKGWTKLQVASNNCYVDLNLMHESFGWYYNEFGRVWQWQLGSTWRDFSVGFDTYGWTGYGVELALVCSDVKPGDKVYFDDVEIVEG